VTRQVQYARALAAGSWSTSGHATPLATTPLSSPGAAIGYDRQTDFQYDRENRRIAQTQVNVEIGKSGGRARARYRRAQRDPPPMANDGVGNQTSMTDATGATTYTYYDSLGRAVATAAPARGAAFGNAVMLIPLATLDYDAFGNVVRTRSFAAGTTHADASGYAAPVATAADQITLAAYDQRGNLIHTVDPEGASRSNSYDVLGRVAKSWMPIVNIEGQVSNSSSCSSTTSWATRPRPSSPPICRFYQASWLPRSSTTRSARSSPRHERPAGVFPVRQRRAPVAHQPEQGRERGIPVRHAGQVDGRDPEPDARPSEPLFSRRAQVAALPSSVERTDTRLDALERASSNCSSRSPSTARRSLRS